VGRRKSQVRQQRRAAERNWGNSRPLSAPTERHKLNPEKALILVTMAKMALEQGNLAAVEFRASADILLRDAIAALNIPRINCIGSGVVEVATVVALQFVGGLLPLTRRLPGAGIKHQF